MTLKRGARSSNAVVDVMNRPIAFNPYPHVTVDRSQGDDQNLHQAVLIGDVEESPEYCENSIKANRKLVSQLQTKPTKLVCVSHLHHSETVNLNAA